MLSSGQYSKPREVWFQCTKGICRIAASFNSPRLRTRRDHELSYEVLRNAETYETSGISSSLHLSQDGTSHEVESTKSSLHIDEGHSVLKVYLPRNKTDQDYQFTTHLPGKLFQRMMTNPNTGLEEVGSMAGITATTHVLFSPRARVVEALDSDGIPEVEIANLDEQVLSEPGSPTTTARASEVEDYLSDQEDFDMENLYTPASSVASPLPNRPIPDRTSFLTPSTPTRGYPFGSSSPARATPTQHLTRDGGYIALLGRVIHAANRSDIPSHGMSGASVLPAGLPSDGEVDWGLRSATKFERDCKIGAAGELYASPRPPTRVSFPFSA